MDSQSFEDFKLKQVMSLDDLAKMKLLAKKIYLSEELEDYIEKKNIPTQRPGRRRGMKDLFIRILKSRIDIPKDEYEWLILAWLMVLILDIMLLIKMVKCYKRNNSNV